MASRRVVVIGAGTAGLAAALTLASRGFEVTVLERAAQPGGKMRQIVLGDRAIDSGPTVFTMRWVFDELFDEAGQNLDELLQLKPLRILARHTWTDGTHLDLFADEAQSADAIGGFSDHAEAEGYRAFCSDARRIFEVLKTPFICAPAPSMIALLRGAPILELAAIKPFQSMWKALGRYFRDPRLQQLFGRYATYCGSSPFDAPATLMLVAHVESSGVWVVEGGMHRLADVMTETARKCGVNVRCGVEVADILTDFGRTTGVKLADGEQIAADGVIATCDVAAIATGLFGKEPMAATTPAPQSSRSLSAMTWSCIAKASGFPLLRHSVFFSRDYRAEFESIFSYQQMPAEPTVYVCAQDRDDSAMAAAAEERLFILINAPADGDRHRYDPTEIHQCARRTFAMLERCGLTIQATPELTRSTTPADFNRLFPATGGALYGRSSHGWTASFQRPGARTKLPGFYLAGGSVHPGPGVPMAALSGRMAATSLMADLASTGS